jgi:hypothetical protein
MTTLLKQIAPDPDEPLMGLQELGLSLFPGCETVLEIPLINGKFSIGEPKAYDEFEKFYGLKFDSEEGKRFLSEYRIVINHDIMSLDTKNMDHKFLLHILKVNNGMGIVATNDTAIDDSAVNTFKFQLTDEGQDLNSRVALKETKLAAYSKLAEMYDTKGPRILTIAKYLFPLSSGIGENKTLAFDKLEDFISKQAGAEKFLEVLRMDADKLRITVIVKEAMYRNIIRRDSDGWYVLHASNTKLGRNEEEIVVYCSDPKNIDIVGNGKKDDLPYSLSTQLKQII